MNEIPTLDLYETKKASKRSARVGFKKENTMVLDQKNTSRLTTERNKTTDNDPKKEAELNKKVKEMMWPWVKSPFVVNNFDNRFKAQDKMLHEQHQMIKGKKIKHFRLNLSIFNLNLNRSTKAY